jgi:hypothetical protein
MLEAGFDEFLQPLDTIPAALARLLAFVSCVSTISKREVLVTNLLTPHELTQVRESVSTLPMGSSKTMYSSLGPRKNL